MDSLRISTSALVLEAVLAFLTAAAPLPAWATSLVVPEQAPSIQAALDAEVDTVFLRPGNYSESPTVSQPVAILGLAVTGTDLPVLAGLTIRVSGLGASPLYDFQRFQVNGHVVTVSDQGWCEFRFLDCSLLGGVADSSQYMDTGRIALSRCRIAGTAELRAKDRILVDSCHVAGSVAAGGPDFEFVVRGCTFEGGGINSASHGSCNVEGNTIRGGTYGIWVEGDNTVVSDNLIEDCQSYGVYAGHLGVQVRNNLVRRCQIGIYASSPGDLLILGNTVVQAWTYGLIVGPGTDVDLASNVFWMCGADGMRINFAGRVSLRVTQNTSCFNGLSGYLCDTDTMSGQEWVANIGYGNGRYGINWLRGGAARVACNDWYNNRIGAVSGRAPSAEDFSVDPLFCDAVDGDFRLDSSSPLADWPGCGLIGALGVGCGKTATLVHRFTAERVGSGIRVIWEVAEGATAFEVWLERSTAIEGAPWIRPLTERSTERQAVVELDKSAALGREYWYRLVALEGSGETVVGAPIVVEAQLRTESRLMEVGPTPGSSPVRIAFALSREGVIEIDVYDLQGRKVASAGQGVWPAGMSEVVWDGRTRNGEAAPAGMYVVRYAYPGGQDRRRIVRIR